MTDQYPFAQVALGDIVDINPRYTLRKGASSRYVGMAHLREYRRRIDRYSERPFLSGTKFSNGDTLMARITPCLENGKTAYVDFLDEEEVAHGSTEFLVLRARSEFLNPLFLYYIATSRRMRNYAVPRMTGTSGRQRISSREIAQYGFNLPPLNVQESIVDELGSIDDRIEHVEQTILKSYDLCDLLYEQVRADPSCEYIPLGDLADISKGVSYKGEFLSNSDLGGELMNLGVFGRERSPRWENVKRYVGPTKRQHHVASGDVIVCATDMTPDRIVLGKSFVVPPSHDGSAFTHHLYALKLRARQSVSPYVLSLALSHEETRRQVANFANGTTVLALPKDALLGVQIPIGAESASTQEISLLFALIEHYQSELDSLFRLNAEVQDLYLGASSED